MRVLHIHDRGRFQGGVEQILHDTAAGLAARGHVQGLLTADSAPCERFSAAFSTIAHTVLQAERFAPDAVVIHKFQDDRTIGDLVDRFPGIQVVHDHDLYCPRRHKYFPLSRRLCESKAGVACAAHLCLIQRGQGGMPLAVTSLTDFRRRKQAAARSELLVAGSRYSAGQLELNGFDRGRVRIIAPVPAAVGSPAALPPGKAGRILFMGQVVRGKGLDLLLTAAARLQGEWTLEVAGDGPQLEECREQATRLGIGARVNFAGWVEHASLHDRLRQSSFVVVPSRWPEPFGMVGIEAMSRGRAVVAFATGGIPDWLENGVTGVLARPGDPASLAVGMQRLLDDPGLSQAMGHAGQEAVALRFSHRRFLDAMESVIQEAISLRRDSLPDALQIAKDRLA
jgi:glycosyltransferase involved in cell wall biosynthesis